MLAERERAFPTQPAGSRASRAPTPSGEPHVVPVCFAVAGETVYITVDEQAEAIEAGRGRSEADPQYLVENPAVALVADHYEEDWRRLGWVMLRGRAEILHEGEGARSGAGAPVRALCPVPGDVPRGRFR